MLHVYYNVRVFVQIVYLQVVAITVPVFFTFNCDSPNRCWLYIVCTVVYSRVVSYVTCALLPLAVCDVYYVDLD